MTTTVQEIDGKWVATLVGELDTAAANDTELALQPLLESGGKDIIQRPQAPFEHPQKGY